MLHLSSSSLLSTSLTLFSLSLLFFCSPFSQRNFVVLLEKWMKTAESGVERKWAAKHRKERAWPKTWVSRTSLSLNFQVRAMCESWKRARTPQTRWENRLETEWEATPIQKKCTSQSTHHKDKAKRWDSERMKKARKGTNLISSSSWIKCGFTSHQNQSHPHHPTHHRQQFHPLINNII